MPGFLSDVLAPFVSSDSPWGTNTIESVVCFVDGKKYKLIAYVDGLFLFLFRERKILY